MTTTILPELAAMQAIADAVATLTPAERRRVAAWLESYVGDDAADGTAGVPETADGFPAIEPEPVEEEGELAAEAEEVVAEPIAITPETFDELLGLVAPKTGAQKAAVAGYWLQTAEGKQSWKASEVNKLLKAAGVSVSSISIVLTNAVKAKNPLVEGLGRLGDGQRSRKTFTLTDTGFDYVGSRLA